VRALAAAPSNPHILIAGAIDGVYRRRLRKNWERISPENQQTCATSIPSQLTRTTPTQLRRHVSPAVKTWTAENLGADSSRHGGRFGRHEHHGRSEDASHIFASACFHIYHSSDGGASWTKFKGIPKGYSEPCTFCRTRSVRIRLRRHTEGLWKNVRRWRHLAPAYSRYLEHSLDGHRSGKSDRMILGTSGWASGE